MEASNPVLSESDRVIEIVAALIRDDHGRVLLVRKRETSAFMQPGGKREPGESDLAALARELQEEIGCAVVPGSAVSLGTFGAPAANEPGARVRAAIYAVRVSGDIVCQGEIAQTRWIDPFAPDETLLAPLTRESVLPMARAKPAPQAL